MPVMILFNALYDQLLFPISHSNATYHRYYKLQRLIQIYPHDQGRIFVLASSRIFLMNL